MFLGESSAQHLQRFNESGILNRSSWAFKLPTTFISYHKSKCKCGYFKNALCCLNRAGLWGLSTVRPQLQRLREKSSGFGRINRTWAAAAKDAIIKAYSLCSVPWLSFLLKAKWGFQEVGPLKCANSTKHSPFVLHQIKFEAQTSVELTFSFSSWINYEN